MRTYSLYLSTDGKNPPLSTAGFARTTWNVNWREIFGNRTGECRVRARLISQSTNLASTHAHGSLRASFSSNTSNGFDGFNIGAIRPLLDYTSSPNNYTYLDHDSTNTHGSTIIIPNSNGPFTVSLCDIYEGYMSVVPAFQLWLYFDVDDENPTVNDKTTKLPEFLNPR